LEALHGFYGVMKRRDGKQGSLFWFAIPYQPDNLYASHLESQSPIHDEIDRNQRDEFDSRSSSNKVVPSSSSSSLEKSSLDGYATTSAIMQTMSSPRLGVRSDLHVNTNHRIPSVPTLNIQQVNQNTGFVTASRSSMGDYNRTARSASASASARSRSMSTSIVTDRTDRTMTTMVSSPSSPTSISGGSPTPSLFHHRKRILPEISSANHRSGGRDVALKALNEDEDEGIAVVAATSLATIPLGLKILLVDDSPTIVKMSSVLLTKLGHSVDTAENGAIAVQMVEDSLFRMKMKFDVILMDLQMPVMDGLEATRRIRDMEEKLTTIQSTTSVRHVVIGISANNDEETMQLAREVGFDSFLPKPFDVKRVIATLQELQLTRN
jgi:CheY-like chemotaxis protein